MNNRFISKNKLDEMRQEFFKTLKFHISDTSVDYVEIRVLRNGSGTIHESSVHVDDFLGGIYNRL